MSYQWNAICDFILVINTNSQYPVPFQSHRRLLFKLWTKNVPAVFLSENYDYRSVIWHKIWAEVSLVLSQFTRLRDTDGHADRLTDIWLMAIPRLHSCSAVIIA